jgi:hypothetical protein
MTTPTVTETVRNGNPVGKRTELGRYTISSGERILYGQRVDGVVRFLPEEPVAVAAARVDSDDDTGSSRHWFVAGVRPDAGPKRCKGEDAPAVRSCDRREIRS